MYFVALATDYDGTLAHDGLVLDATISALEDVKKTGRKIVLVTGREMKDLREVFPRYEIFDRIVAENGAVIYTPATQEEKVIAPPPPDEFVERLRALKVEPLSVGRSIVATWEPNEATVLDVIRDIGLELHIVFNKGEVMVLPANVNKASGLAAALEEMGISPLNTIAIGDAENDHAFLTASGCAVAVANALDAVKASADLVTKAARGDGVQEVLATLVAGREGDVITAARRHAVVFASDESGEEVSHYPSRGSILISGRSGAGKSTLSTALLELMMMRGFQTCIVDPEGDYSELEGATVMGSADAPPRMKEVFDLLADPATNVVVNLLGVEVDRRPAFLARLLPKLSSLRVASGRPHWVLIDEAHHMFPVARESVPMTLPKELPSAILVTVHPASVAPAALELIDTVIGVGEGALDVITEACKAMGDRCPPLPEGRTDPKHAVMWTRRPEVTMRRIIVEQTRQAHRRHTRKYAQGNLGEDRSFYFRGPENALNLRVQNLMLFVQIGNGADERTWLHHLRAGDYSDWFRNAIKDEELANEASEVEADASLSAEESRARIMALVTKRYTAPAADDGDMID